MRRSIYVCVSINCIKKIILVEKRVVEMEDPRTRGLLETYNGMLAFANATNYTIVDISNKNSKKRSRTRKNK